MRLTKLFAGICLMAATSVSSAAEAISDEILDLKSALNLENIENMVVDTMDDVPVRVESSDSMESNSPDSHRSMKVNERIRATEQRMNRDVDADGFSIVDGDCDDTDPMTYPKAYESHDGIDNNCDGVIDNGMVKIRGVDAKTKEKMRY